MAEIRETLPDIVNQACDRFGAADAVIEGRCRTSFRALRDAAARAAGAFAEAGVAKGDRVALWAPNSTEWIVACIAAQWAGATVVPINTRLKGAEAGYILRRTGARLLLTVSRFAGNHYLAMIEDEDLPALEGTICLDRDWNAIVRAASPIAPSAQPDGIADIIFTSGTTGLPKGVMSNHRQNLATMRAWAARVGLRHGDRYLLVNPFFHTFGYKAGWMACLLTGATALPVASFDVEAMAELIRDERVSVLTGAPTIFQSLLDLADARERGGTLRIAVTGAASVPPTLIERMRSELAIPTVLTGYGLTESTGVVTMSNAGDSAEVVATTAGRPIPGIEVRCVDETGTPVPSGDQGEIVVRGFNVMQGYFDDPASTDEAIDSAGWLHTGDIGRFVHNGCLQVTDRLKDMYISGGFNCYPAEIERLLSGHPAIASCAIIGVPDERLGEVGKAFIVPRPGTQIEPAEVISWARTAMANYKAPRFVEIVDTLPTNAAGKVQKFALRT